MKLVMLVVKYEGHPSGTIALRRLGNTPDTATRAAYG
jgi:hypothetical protein